MYLLQYRKITLYLEYDRFDSDRIVQNSLLQRRKNRSRVTVPEMMVCLAWNLDPVLQSNTS